MVVSHHCQHARYHSILSPDTILCLSRCIRGFSLPLCKSSNRKDKSQNLGVFMYASKGLGVIAHSSVYRYDWEESSWSSGLHVNFTTHGGRPDPHFVLFNDAGCWPWMTSIEYVDGIRHLVSEEDQTCLRFVNPKLGHEHELLWSFKIKTHTVANDFVAYLIPLRFVIIVSWVKLQLIKFKSARSSEIFQCSQESRTRFHGFRNASRCSYAVSTLFRYWHKSCNQEVCRKWLSSISFPSITKSCHNPRDFAQNHHHCVLYLTVNHVW